MIHTELTDKKTIALKSLQITPKFMPVSSK